MHYRGARVVMVAVFLHAAATAHASGSLAGQVEVQIEMVRRAERLVWDYSIRGEEHAYLLPRFIAFAERNGTPVYRVPLAKDTKRALLGLLTCPWTATAGYRCVILLDDTANGADGQVYTLVHELSHRLQHKDVKPGPESEVWAEVIAWLVVSELGMHTTDVTMSYLATLPQVTRERVLRTRERDIRKVVERLVKVGRTAA